MREEAPSTARVVEVQDQACGRWSGENGTQLLLAILIGRARQRVVTCDGFLIARTRKNGSSQYAVCDTRRSDDPSTCRAFYNLDEEALGKRRQPSCVCDWCDADTCDSPSIGVPNEGVESLTKREFHFFVLLEFDVCCQLLLLRFCSRCQCVQRRAT